MTTLTVDYLDIVDGLNPHSSPTADGVAWIIYDASSLRSARIIYDDCVTSLRPFVGLDDDWRFEFLVGMVFADLFVRPYDVLMDVDAR